jgi:hypothetical protein
MQVKLLLIVVLTLFFGSTMLGQEGIYNVKDFGAVGDGKTDDTFAIQAALTKARQIPRGATVVLPPGGYRVTKPLVVENALLTGLVAGGWPADRGPLPTLVVDHTEGPCIIAKDAASVHGLNFEYDHKGQQTRKFGPTILLSGNGISISNLRIHQPYDGIIADGKSNIGRLNIENVFIINVRSCGVYVTNTLDIPTLRNIEVWNPPKYALQNAIGFKLGKNDLLRMDNCFAFQCKVGYLFVDDKEKLGLASDGGTWGHLVGCSADACAEGIVVESAVSLQITGGSLWCHQTSMRIKGPGRIVVTGVEMQANGDSQLIIENCENVTVSGCRFGKASEDWKDVYAVRIEGGSNIILNACNFDGKSRGIYIGKKAEHFSITNNLFVRSPYETIKDESAESASKIISGNLTKQTDNSK